MQGDDLPEDDRVSRYCKPSSIDDGMLLPAAFEIRKNEDHLSVNWIEYFGEPSLPVAVGKIRNALRDKNYQIKPSGRFAMVPVRDVVETAPGATGQRLRVKHMPEPKDESHSGIFGYTAADYDIAATLAAQARFVAPAEGR